MSDNYPRANPSFPTAGEQIARHLIRNGWTKEPRP